MNRGRFLGSVPCVGALIASGMLLAAAAPAAAAQASGGLAGAWASIDSDGSHQTLDITGTGTRVYSMVYVDDVATGACAGDPARLSGPGHVDDDGVTMVAAFVCLPGGGTPSGSAWSSASTTTARMTPSPTTSESSGRARTERPAGHDRGTRSVPGDAGRRREAAGGVGDRAAGR